MLKKEGLESSSDNLNPSWRDILLNLSEDDEENDIINIWSQPIWFNYNTNRNCSVFIIEIIFIMVYYLLMILSLKINSLLSYQTFQNKYIIGTNFHEIYAIVCAVPKGWKQIFQSMGECMLLKMTLLTD
jgi:hypothetical protein